MSKIFLLFKKEFLSNLGMDFLVCKVSSVGSKIKLTCEENSCGLSQTKVFKIECKCTGIHPLHLPSTMQHLLLCATIIHTIQHDFKPI